MISDEYNQLRIPLYKDPEDPTNVARLLSFPLWIGDQPGAYNQFDNDAANDMYNAWTEFYSPGEIADPNKMGLRILWMNAIRTAAGTIINKYSLSIKHPLECLEIEGF